MGRHRSDDIGHRQHLVHRRGDLVEHSARRAAWRKKGLELAGLHTGKAGLGVGRDVRCHGQALARGDKQGGDALGLYLRQRRRRIDEVKVKAPGDLVGQRLRGSLVGYVGAANTSLFAEQFHRQVRGRTRSGGAIGGLAPAGDCARNQVFCILVIGRWRGDQDHRRPGDVHQRHQIAIQVVRHDAADGDVHVHRRRGK